ncbi:acyl carrier protein [Streptomyces sp. uw30]|uniref:acyl carrier protein n=1 Tax=Streptomyces sp. uw30 TaxID=1828179 RepID=UPI0011CE63E8|nr:acyl carrier protein [Streptomyces sp. uw30]TXS51778.1 acyl carrier protein [Streptomyces sp. uw30]
MRELNENASAAADQRATAEAIERGGVGLTVTDLLAKVTGSADAPVRPEAANSSVPDRTESPSHGTDASLPHGTTPPVSPEASPSAQPGDLDELATAIAAVAGRYVPAGQLAPDADFFDAGGTSVNAVELVSALEDELGVTVDLDEVFADARPVALAKRRLPDAAVVTAGPTPAAAAIAVPETAVPAATHALRPAPVAAPSLTDRPDTVARPEDLTQILADLALADRHT